MFDRPDITYYEILGIKPDAKPADIHKAYRKMSQRFHPDKAKENKITEEQATAAMKKLNEIKETLSDPKKRFLYDYKHIISKNKPEFKYTNNSKKFNYSNMRSFYKGFKWESNFRFKKDFFYQDSFFHEFKSEFKTEKTRSGLYPVKLNDILKNIIVSDSITDLANYLKNNTQPQEVLETLLYKACCEGKFNIAKYLIEICSIDPKLNVRDEIFFNGEVFKAAAEGGNLELVKYLFENHQANVESKSDASGLSCTALSRAARAGHTDVVAYLISKGANLNPEVSHTNILNESIKSNNFNIFKLLVESGSKMESYTLSYALKSGNLEIVTYILSIKPGLKNHLYLEPPACLVAQSGNVELLKYLEKNEQLVIYDPYMDYYRNIYRSILIAAVYRNNFDMMRYLISEKKLLEKCEEHKNMRLICCSQEDFASYQYICLSGAIQYNPPEMTAEEYYKRIDFLRWLMDDIKIQLPQTDLKKLIENAGNYIDIRINAYLHYLLMEDKIIPYRNLLLKISEGNGLSDLNISELFRLFNTNILTKSKCSDHRVEIHNAIESHNITGEQLTTFAKSDAQFKIDAFYYYSSYLFQQKSSVDIYQSIDTNDSIADFLSQYGLFTKAFQKPYDKRKKVINENTLSIPEKSRELVTEYALIVPR